MLNGLAPIILFRFYKATPEVESFLSKIPLMNSFVSKVSLPPIPLYLDEGLTGILIENENKSIDIETKVDTTSTGTAEVNQKGLGSTITVTMTASQGSLGVTLLSAMSDMILKKVTSAEYSITYMHKSIVAIDYLLNSLSIEPVSGTTLYRITMSLSIGKPAEVVAAGASVEKIEGAATPLTSGVPAGPPTVLAPPSPAQPPLPAPASPAFQMGVQG